MGQRNIKKSKVYKSEATVYVAYIGPGKGSSISCKRKKDVNFVPTATVDKFFNKYAPRTKEGKIPSIQNLEYPGNIKVTPVRKSIYENNKDVLRLFETNPSDEDKSLYLIELTEFVEEQFGYKFSFNEKTKMFDPVVEEETPVAEEETPVVEEETPVVEEETPVVEEETPDPLDVEDAPAI